MKKALRRAFGERDAVSAPSPRRAAASVAEDQARMAKLVGKVADKASRHPDKAAHILSEWLQRGESRLKKTG
jgi:hypothetical protein